MDILIDENKKILEHLNNTEKILSTIEINDNISNKIKIIYETLIDVTSSLNKLNINLKNHNLIELSTIEQEFLICEERSNKLITKLMPALIMASLNLEINP